MARAFRKTQRLLLTTIALLLPAGVSAQWAAQPGQTVRNGFGPPRGEKTTLCRGACGAGCPKTCDAAVVFECVDSATLRRVEIFECGTHQGCRQHDDCLDRCSQQHEQGFDCQSQCHSEAVESFGLESTTSWATGGGPFDGPPITFEYTRDFPADPEPAFRCPEGANLECGDTGGRCVRSSGTEVDPIFDSYPEAGPDAMRISGFRAGPLCKDHVCAQRTDIRVTGQDSCDRGSGSQSCTRYGIEFDYVNADPSTPLECSTSTSGGDSDFVGDLLAKGLRSMPETGNSSGEGTDASQGEDGLGELLGIFQKVVNSADSPEDVQISMAPLGPDGQPIESQRVGSTGQSGPPPVPRSVDLTASSGHLLVPMYQVADPHPSQPLVRKIRCTHKGLPVLETTFRLRF